MGIGLAAALTAGVIGLVGGSARAQGPGGQMPPEFAAKLKLWRKYGEDHKKASTLGLAVRRIEGMNKEEGFKLDKKQSAKVLAIMKTYGSKPSMTEDEAGAATSALNSVLTVKQVKKMTTMPNGFGRSGAMGGGRPGGPGGGAPGGGGPRPGGPGGGPGGPGGGFTLPDPPKTGINPFNPNSMSGPLKDMMKKNLDTFKSDLQKQSK